MLVVTFCSAFYLQWFLKERLNLPSGMGTHLSIAQRDIYLSFVGILTVNKVKYSKGQLKRFVRKLFLHFPDTTPEAEPRSSIGIW